MAKRRSLTSQSTTGPTDGDGAWSELDVASTGRHAMRRSAARHEVSERIVLHGLDPFGLAERAHALEGWALNASRGGVRVLLEAPSTLASAVLELGREYEMMLGSPLGTAAVPFEGEGEVPSRIGSAVGRPLRARVVWLQEEPDGVIAGLEFVSPLDSEPRLRVQRAVTSAPRIRARQGSDPRDEEVPRDAEAPSAAAPGSAADLETSERGT